MHRYASYLVLLFGVMSCGPYGVQNTADSTSSSVDADVASPSNSLGTTKRICWGDLHGHTTVSDGNIHPQDYFQKARDEARVDFVAVTDHIYFPLKYGPLNKENWANLQGTAAHFHQPKKFVTFTGFEWTTSGGHFTAYIPGDYSPIFENDNFPNTLDGIAQMVAQADGLLHVAHPVVRSEEFDIVKWEFSHLPSVTNAEVYGYKGRLFEEGYKYLLSKGLKLGAIGVSDIHKGSPGNGGLTAVWVNECTQKEILEGLRNRRNYASTGERAELLFKADEHWMGEEYSPDGFPLLTVSIKATTVIESVKIFRDDIAIYVNDPHSFSTELEHKDETWNDETSHYYRVEVLMQNGQRLWSSPIWTIKKN